jgi:FkbM family methyltransferase
MNARRAAERGRVEFEDFCRLRAASYQPAGRDPIVRVLGECPFEIDPDDTEVAPHLALDGFWESWVNLWLFRTVRPGWRCVDVGAHLGYYTLLLDKLIGETGHVIALEPNPDTQRRLATNCRLNGVRATLLPWAAGEQEGSATLHCDRDRAGSGTLRARAAAVALPVQVRRVDDVVRPPIQLLKVDAEGWDIPAILGAAGLLAASPGCLVLFEHCSDFFDSADAERAALGRLLGMLPGSLRAIEGDGTARPVHPGEVLASPGRLWNLVIGG